MRANFFTRDTTTDPNVKAGPWTYGAPNVWYADADATVTIGRYTSIAPYVFFFLKADHRTDWVTTYPFSGLGDMFPEVSHIPGHPTTNGPITVGSDVWIAGNVIVLSGVTIGDGAVVLQGSVVMDDVPPFAIVAGNPARPIRYRGTPDQIEAMLRISWWEWPDQKVRSALRDLCSPDLDAFIKKHGMV